MKARPPIVVCALLLLAGTHAAVYLLARGAGAAGQGNEELREISYFPAKSTDRGAGLSPPAVAGRGGSFRRLLRELEQSGMSRSDFETAREALVCEWLRRDLRGAMELLFDPLAGDRYERLAAILSDEIAAEIVRQPREVWSWIAGHRFGTQGRRAFDIWSSALIGAGQCDILLECMAGDWRYADQHLVAQLCDKVTVAQLPQVRALLAARPDLLDETDQGSLPYTKRMATETGRDPMPFLAVEKDKKLRSAFLHDWMKRELSFLPAAEAVAALDVLPEGERDGVAADLLLTSASSGGSRGVAEMINAIEGKGLLGDLAGEWAEFGHLAFMQMEESPYTTVADAYRALQGIRAAPLRQFALEDLVRRCDGEDDLLECLAVAPAGAERDHFLRGFMLRSDADPALRERLFAEISDPQTAAEVRGEIEAKAEKEGVR